jgi:hypothetical protein
LSDANIFSGINTFANKNWVCEWYVKMFLYMLNFASVDNSEVLRWYVLDAQDFPQVWHAWIKIWDKYYDPTFDDPVWQLKTKTFTEYKYFWLPYDLFYTNRYNFDEIPSILKEKDLTYRESFITQKTIPLISKYRYSWYNILKPYILRLEYWIDYNKKLDVNDLKKIVKYYELNNFQFIENWVTKTIKTLKYYSIDNLNIDDLVEQLNYDFKQYYLFKWKLVDWSYEYRLGYDVEFK